MNLINTSTSRKLRENGTLKFGQMYANRLRRKQAQRGDKWFLDEVVPTIKGQHHYLWRAVDQDGFTLDILMQSRRNRHAEKRFFRKLLRGLHYALRVIITDKLKSYAAAKRECAKNFITLGCKTKCHSVLVHATTPN